MKNTPPTILLIESGFEVTYLFERYAQQGCWNLITARTSFDATVAAWHARPDIIFINTRLQFPGRGWAVLQAFRNDSTFRNIPIVTYASIDEGAQAKKEGADFSLCQPILYEDVQIIMQQVALTPLVTS